MVELKMAVVLDMNLFLLGGTLSQVPWSVYIGGRQLG